MSVYIGIDPGTKCGWAVLAEDGRRLASGVWDLSGGRFDGGGMRFVRARQQMLNLLTAYPLDVFLAYEEVRSHKGTDAARVYHGIVSQFVTVCEERSVPYTAAPVGTVKKLATGKGNASKEEMVATARLRWPDANVTDDNEADALWIAETLRQGEI